MRYFCVRCGLSLSRFYQLSRPIRAFQSEHAILLARQLVVVDETTLQSTGELLAQIVDRLDVRQLWASRSTVTMRSFLSFLFSSDCSPSMMPIGRHDSMQPAKAGSSIRTNLSP